MKERRRESQKEREFERQKERKEKYEQRISFFKEEPNLKKLTILYSHTLLFTN